MSCVIVGTVGEALLRIVRALRGWRARDGVRATDTTDARL